MCVRHAKSLYLHSAAEYGIIRVEVERSMQMKSFLFANVPLSVVHFVLFVLFKGFLGQPGYVVADTLGASNGGILWWMVMVVNSLVWGAVLSLFVLPFLRKVLR